MTSKRPTKYRSCGRASLDIEGANRNPSSAMSFRNACPTITLVFRHTDSFGQYRTKQSIRFKRLAGSFNAAHYSAPSRPLSRRRREGGTQTFLLVTATLVSSPRTDTRVRFRQLAESARSQVARGSRLLDDQVYAAAQPRKVCFPSQQS